MVSSIMPTGKCVVSSRDSLPFNFDEKNKLGNSLGANQKIFKYRNKLDAIKYSLIGIEKLKDTITNCWSTNAPRGYSVHFFN